MRGSSQKSETLVRGDSFALGFFSWLLAIRGVDHVRVNL